MSRSIDRTRPSTPRSEEKRMPPSKELDTSLAHAGCIPGPQEADPPLSAMLATFQSVSTAMPTGGPVVEPIDGEKGLGFTIFPNCQDLMAQIRDLETQLESVEARIALDERSPGSLKSPLRGTRDEILTKIAGLKGKLGR